MVGCCEGGDIAISLPSSFLADIFTASEGIEGHDHRINIIYGTIAKLPDGSGTRPREMSVVWIELCPSQRER